MEPQNESESQEHDAQPVLEVTMAAARDNYRLPLDLVPKHYDIAISTNLDKFEFNGVLDLQIKCLHPTYYIFLHSKDLQIDGDTLKIKTLETKSRMIQIIACEMDEDNDFLILTTSVPLVLGKVYNLHLAFRGQLMDNLVGFYRSSFTDKTTGQKRWLAVTHFEPSNARRAFPCLDEPALKASFTITLYHPEGMVALSNMPKSFTRRAFSADKVGLLQTEFQTTLPMSTYLVGFAVGPLSKHTKPDVPGRPIFSVYVRPDAIEQATFAGNVGPKFLKFFEEFFRVDYPLPKQDLLAIPDFKIGAMENWGIITFRESCVLLEESSTSATAKLDIATVIAHEIAHMWFGNLVTMSWWTDLWLKEGFATYMATIAVHDLYPEWNSIDAEVLSGLLRVFHLDSLKSSHAVSVPIGDPKEIPQIFDAISYEKGSFLLRMLSAFLGMDVFRDGVTRYLEKHQFGNAEQDDLWDTLTQEAHKNKILPLKLHLKTIMDTWTLQAGYPLVSVCIKSNRIYLSQNRFLAGNEEKPDCASTWWIPISFSTETAPNFINTRPKDWMSANEQDKVLKGFHVGDEEWIVLNNRASGLYKVNYEKKNWEFLIRKLHSPTYTEIDLMNRALLITDVMDLAECEIVSYDLALRLISYAKQEGAFAPLKALLAKLEPLHLRLCRLPSYGTLKEFTKILLRPIAETVDTYNESSATFEEEQLVNLISQWAEYVDVGVKDATMALFDAWYTSGNPDDVNPIPKNLRKAVYSKAVATGGSPVWDFLWARYLAANVPSEKINLLSALANTRQVWLISRYLSWTLIDGSGVRKQDAVYVFRMVAKNDVGFYIAQKFFFKNIVAIAEYFGGDSDIIGHYFSVLAEQMVFQDEYEEMKTFAIKYQEELSPASLTVEQALETIKVNIRWLNTHLKGLISSMDKIITTTRLASLSLNK